MTVAVNSPAERRRSAAYDDMDIILKGVGIATQFYGQQMDNEKQDQLAKIADQRHKEQMSQSSAIAQRDFDFKEKQEANKLAENEKDRQNKLAEARLKDSGKAPSLGHKITATEAGSIGSMQAVDKALDKVWADYKTQASETGAGISSWVPGSQSKIYENSRKPSAQVIGSVLEGGKLSDADAERYKSMLPSPWDTNSEAEAKIKAIKDLAKIKIEGQVTGLKKSGFDTSGFESSEGSQQVVGVPSQGMNEAAANVLTPGTVFNKGGKRYQVNPDGKTATVLP